MQHPNFTAEDLRLVLWACSAVHATDCTPEFLQGFISRRLDGRDADLAEKVRALDEARMDALCRYVAEAKKIAAQLS